MVRVFYLIVSDFLIYIFFSIFFQERIYSTMKNRKYKIGPVGDGHKISYNTSYKSTILLKIYIKPCE